MPNDSHDTASNSTGRRRFLKIAGVGAVGGLAGCTGEDGEASPTATNQGTSSPSTAGDSEPVTFDYWSTIATQSGTAEATVRAAIQQFEQNTGGTVQLNATPNPAQQTQTWISTFQSGDWPVMFDAAKLPAGFVLNEDWVYPFDEWQHKLSDEALSQIEWTFPILESAFVGTDWADLVFLPFATRCWAPIWARRDHFEEAGLSPQDDFPPQSQQEFVEIGEQLTDGPSEFPLYINGQAGDIFDAGLFMFSVPEGGPNDGTFLNEDATGSNFQKDVWQKITPEFVNIYREMELSGPWTPTASDEDLIPRLANGTVSMGHGGFLTLAQMLEQAPGLVEDGTIMWGANWPGPTNNRGVWDAFQFGLTRKPPEADADEWERKQDAAISLMDTWLTTEFQSQIPEALGLLPVREDVMNQITGNYRDDHIVNAVVRMINETETTLIDHPQSVAIFTEPAAPMQNALRGEVTPQEALNQADSLINDILSG